MAPTNLRNSRGRQKQVCVNQSIIDMFEERLKNPNINENYAVTIKRAVRSLRNHNQIIRTREQALKVPKIGNHLAAQIVLHLQKHPPPPEQSSQPNNHEDDSDDSEEESAQRATQSTRGSQRPPNTRRKGYTPRYRSAPYGVIIALHVAKQAGHISMKKNELINAAQQYCDEPLIKTSTHRHSTWYDGWSSMGKTLISKHLIVKFSSPAKYSLTPEGMVLAERLMTIHNNMQNRVVDNYDAVPPPPEPAPNSTPSESVEQQQVPSTEVGQQQVPSTEVGQQQTVNRRKRRPKARSSSQQPDQPSVLESRNISNPSNSLGAMYDVEHGTNFNPTNTENRNDRNKRTRKRASKVTAEREARVVRRLQNLGYERDKCISIIEELNESGNTLKSDDKLYEAVTNLLWERRDQVTTNEDLQQQQTDEIDLCISYIGTRDEPSGNKQIPPNENSFANGSVHGVDGLSTLNESRNLQSLSSSAHETNHTSLSTQRTIGQIPKTSNHNDERKQQQQNSTADQNNKQAVQTTNKPNTNITVINLDSDGESSIELVTVQPKKRPRTDFDLNRAPTTPRIIPSKQNTSQNLSTYLSDGQPHNQTQPECTSQMLTTTNLKSTKAPAVTINLDDSVVSVDERTAKRSDPSSAGSCLRSLENQHERTQIQYEPISDDPSDMPPINIELDNSLPPVQNFELNYMQWQNDSAKEKDRCLDSPRNRERPHVNLHKSNLNTTNRIPSSELITIDLDEPSPPSHEYNSKLVRPQADSILDSSQSRDVNQRRSPSQNHDTLSSTSPCTIPSRVINNRSMREISPKGTCSVVLILDSMERVHDRSSSSSTVNSFEKLALQEKMIYEIRCLPCGDALFLARYDDGTEYVLDYIIERKTLEDFACSMRDGRVSRQSYVLRKSEIRNKIFLLEGRHKDFPNLSVDIKTCKKLTELEICYGFYIKRTLNLADTVWFYGSMQKKLLAKCEKMQKEHGTKIGEEFDAWMSRMKSIKQNATVGDVFQIQLCQIGGVGKNSAATIVKKGFSTTQLLFRALQTAQLDNKEQFLRNLEREQGDRKLPKKACENITKLFCCPDYGTSVLHNG